MLEVILNDRLGKKIRVKCNEDDTIGDLKKLVAAQTGKCPLPTLLHFRPQDDDDLVTSMSMSMTMIILLVQVQDRRRFVFRNGILCIRITSL